MVIEIRMPVCFLLFVARIRGSHTPSPQLALLVCGAEQDPHVAIFTIRFALERSRERLVIQGHVTHG